VAIIDELLKQQQQLQNQPQAPVADAPPQQTSSWVQDLISKRYDPQTERLKRNPMGFDFQREPYDPSSYYKQLGQYRDISRTQTTIAQQVAANHQAKAQQAALEAAQAAANAATSGIQANFGTSVGNVVGKVAGRVGSIISSGMKELGKPYIYGNEGPNSFDCSGLMQYIFKENGIKLPRTAAQQQRAAKRVSNPRPGDLVFYGYPAHHVALYLGNGKMLAAPHSGANVRVQPVYGNPTYGRI
jgi:cell wall-associated NlpC family hydrolase